MIVRGGVIVVRFCANFDERCMLWFPVGESGTRCRPVAERDGTTICLGKYPLFRLMS